jgi:hypothetical protein
MLNKTRVVEEKKAHITSFVRKHYGAIIFGMLKVVMGSKCNFHERNKTCIWNFGKETS